MAQLDPALHTAAVAALEVAVNQALQLDAATRGRLADLEGSSFHFQCLNPALDVYLSPGAERLQLAAHSEAPVTTAIRGQASDFAELATASDPAAALINGNLQLDGDSAPLIELQKILSGLDMDWEAPLVDALGDVAGHQLAQALRGLFGWGQQATGSLGRQLGEFIFEEARLTPSRAEVEDFYQDVQELSLRVERLQARLRQVVSRARQE